MLYRGMEDNMDKFNLKEVALRLKSLRELEGMAVEELAVATGVDCDEYIASENGERDFSFNFLYNCANKLECNITELITGESAKLSHFTITRKGNGMPIVRNSGFNYLHLASNMRNRSCEPFVVSIPYSIEVENKPIEVSIHSGQELDYVLEGELRVSIAGHETILHQGDSVYYNSDMPHGLMATGGRDAKILAVVLK